MTKANYERIRSFMLRHRAWKNKVWFWNYMGLNTRELDAEKPKY